MWQSLRGKFAIIKNLFAEHNKILNLSALPFFSAKISQFSTTPVILSTPFVNETIASSSPFKLITVYSGFSKEYFNGNTSNLINEKNCICGDDSWFIASQKGADVLGIADGVGGWRELGVDPSKFSSSLMKQCKRVVEQDNNLFSNSQTITKITPVEILLKSYNALLENKDPSLIGSSTACIIVFNRESKYLYSANLGDSGFIIVRNNKIVHRSQEQCHYFNAPFQLSLLPSMSNEETLIQDSPISASTSSFKLNEGDFIVLATDGLWDNLNENILLSKISKLKVYLVFYFLNDAIFHLS